MDSMSRQEQLGQYFTTNLDLQRAVFGFIKNDTKLILEPSVGRGDLVAYVQSQNPLITFDMYEIDDTIELLPDIDSDRIIFDDFLNQEITQKYYTIIGNPPYVKINKGNLYIEFIKKCFQLLEEDGELIFIVPSDFLKLTCAVSIINELLDNGSFTDIYHPHDEKLFQGASIDVLVFRYQKTKDLTCVYNNIQTQVNNNNGMITFGKESCKTIPIKEFFNVYVGMVSGKEDIFKNSELGNIEVLTSEQKYEKYIFLKKIPSEESDIWDYLQSHKTTLLNRKIRKFNDTNWYQWGAPRNITIMENSSEELCIYMHNLTRKISIAFIDKIQYFGGNLIMLNPKIALNLPILIEYFNSHEFKKNFEFSGRFKIGQRQISNMQIPEELFQTIHI